MKITAWDKKREQYIPQGEFAITGDGRLLIQKNESILLYPPGTPSGDFSENDGMSADDVVLSVEEHEHE